MRKQLENPTRVVRKKLSEADLEWDAYTAGQKAAEDDSRELIRRMDRWRAGYGEKPSVDDYFYRQGLDKMLLWQEPHFKAGYQEKWDREREMFGDRMF
jgi:hypothetical protein